VKKRLFKKQKSFGLSFEPKKFALGTVFVFNIYVVD